MNNPLTNKNLKRIFIKRAQSPEEEEELPHDSTEDEVLVFAPLFDKVIQASIPPTEEEENVVSRFPFQVFDDALFYDLESKEVLEKPLDVLDPSCYNEGDDVIDNIDEFICVGKCKWDVTCHDGDPIYDIQGHFQLVPSKQPYVIAID
jgi:hypothetical protein